MQHMHIDIYKYIEIYQKKLCRYIYVEYYIYIYIYIYTQTLFQDCSVTNLYQEFASWEIYR